MPQKKTKKVCKLPLKKGRKLPPELTRMLTKFSCNSFVLKIDEDINDRPIYGTTLYIATCKIETLFGDFIAYVFQDIIHKGYIIALAYGDYLKAKTLYTRIHSSCITSETLRGCDCDCVEQLNGALEVISKKGHGILFYLMQEGRGVGYISKARDRMLVQASEDKISTFEAYQLQGLKPDYRQYRNIVPICKMLEIEASFVLLTNNPTKVTAMKELGFNVKKVEPLEYKPSPYNLAYLTSKMQSGHILSQPKEMKRAGVKTPEPVIPFKPHALPNAQRFIYTASYFLPIRPIHDEIVLSDKQYANIFSDRSIDAFKESEDPIVLEYSLLRNNRYKIKINREISLKYADENPKDPLCDLLHIPYWFKVHVYFDIITDEEFVVLTYGTPRDNESPIVRIQSESLFNRFPVKDAYEREKYKASLSHIIDYGVGIILHLYSDGRGAGLAAYAQDLMFMEKGVSANTMDSYKKLGVSYDLRDYEASMIILRHHLPDGCGVQMVMNSPSSLIRKTEYTESLNKIGLNVDHWIFLDE